MGKLNGNMESAPDTSYLTASYGFGGVSAPSPQPAVRCAKENRIPYEGISLVAESTWWLEGKLKVNEQDSFFFDHPLDHVPGILQIFGLLDIVRAAAVPGIGFERDFLLWLDIDFPAFCELDSEVRLGCSEISAGEPRAWQLRAEQKGSVVCIGRLELRRLDKSSLVALMAEDCATEKGSNGSAPVCPAPGNNVHRVNSDNIIIGRPEIGLCGSDEVPIISPCQDHFLLRSARNEHSPEELIEAARQFAVLLEETASDQVGGTQILLRSIRADFPCGIPRIPLRLRATKVERRGNRRTHEIRIMTAGRKLDIGGFVITGRIVSKEAYNRMRGISR